VKQIKTQVLNLKTLKNQVPIRHLTQNKELKKLVKNKRRGVGGGRRFLLSLLLCGRRKIFVFLTLRRRRKKKWLLVSKEIQTAHRDEFQLICGQ